MEAKELAERMALVNALHRCALNREREQLGQKRVPVPLMEYVLEHPGCTQEEAAKWLYISAASVAASCKRLEKEGLIERRVDPVNRRRNQLFVTEAGQRLTVDKRAMLDRVNERAFENISPEDRQTLCRILDKMQDNLGGRGMSANQVFGTLMEEDKRKDRK
ncbi:MAG: winged helix-turn-helix transcriptional regulator [Clostridia bacterium]|nr:winged helix-turn-helix transcriptional regulator [Clostridia bacterium]